MAKDNLIAKLYKSPKTVLTITDLALIWRETDKNNLKSKIAYYVKKGELIRLSRGVFAKDKNYNPKELATSLYVPSYISFETVLREAGVIFQHYDAIFAASPWSLTKKIDGHKLVFRKLKDSVLFSPIGIRFADNYNVATTERAFLDTAYLFPGYYLDNLKPIDWNRCGEIVKIYHNRELEKRLDKYQKQYAE